MTIWLPQGLVRTRNIFFVKQYCSILLTSVVFFGRLGGWVGVELSTWLSQLSKHAFCDIVILFSILFSKSKLYSYQQE